MSVLGFIILFFALIVTGAAQAALALGVMYGMHKLILEKLAEPNYLEFSFDNFQKPAFQELLVRLAVIFLVPTLVLHLLIYACVSWYYFVYYRALLCLILLVLESGAIAAGFHFLFKLDRFRLAVLTASSA